MANGTPFHPGAAKYGNFINYYDFNAPESRLELLHKDLTSLLELDCQDRIVCLDIGCNSGEMTFALQDRLSCGGRTKIDFLAVDLDEVLIERAQEKSTLRGGQSRTVAFKQLDVMDEQLTANTFQTYLNSDDRNRRKRFDVGFCLSITMWIHLNHGDEGLVRFLRTISSWVDHLVIEPQPLRCYKTAVRRRRRLGYNDFPHDLKTLQFRENDAFRQIEGILVEKCNMVPLFSFGETNNWKRPIVLYKRNT